MRYSPPPVRLLMSTVVSIYLIAISVPALCQTQITNDPPYYGPYNAIFLPDGDGLKKPLMRNDSVLRADSPWSLYAWVNPAELTKSMSLVAGIGEPEDEYSRYLGLDGEHVTLWLGRDNTISGVAPLVTGKWHFLAATFDGGEFRLYSDGIQVASGKLDLGSVSPSLQMAPRPTAPSSWRHFGGSIASLTLVRSALSSDDVKQLFGKSTDFSRIEFEEGSKQWPVQTRGQAGYRAPQDPATMPHSNAPILAPRGEDSSGSGDSSGKWRKQLDPGCRLAHDFGAECKCRRRGNFAA